MRWIAIAIRTALTWFAGAVVTIFCSTVILITAFINDTSPLIERLIALWSMTWLKVSGTKLTVTGREHIDHDRSYVVVANHLSTLDIMSCFLAVDLPIRYLAKAELFKIPILAQGMRAAGIIEVDRSARGAIHATVNRQAKELIAKKRSLVIYPEGTRPRNGVMKPFKKGAFTMAVAGQLPILPVSIHGAYDAAPPGKPWFYGGHIRVMIDPALETAGKTQADTGDLRDQTRELIARRIAEMDQA